MPSGTGREWKGKKWWIALPIATRTIDRYPLGLRGQGAGTSPGAAHTRAWAGVRGGVTDLHAARPTRGAHHCREVPRKDDTTATFSLRLERAKWAENQVRLMYGILKKGRGVNRTALSPQMDHAAYSNLECNTPFYVCVRRLGQLAGA